MSERFNVFSELLDEVSFILFKTIETVVNITKFGLPENLYTKYNTSRNIRNLQAKCNGSSFSILSSRSYNDDCQKNVFDYFPSYMCT